MLGREIVCRWPHIERFLRVESPGWVESDFHWWLRAAGTLSQNERAAAHEEWADFFEWRLEQRAAELANDRTLRHLVTEWTDSMAYCSRRLAAVARGADPGEWIPQHARRPELEAERRAIVADIIAGLGRA